jgi:hypothetical protein
VETKFVHKNIKERYSDVQISTLRPHSETTLIVNYR